MSTQEGFLTTPASAEFFFRCCRRFKIDGRVERIALMRELARRGRAKYVRDVAALTKGKRVLHIKGDKGSQINES